MSSRDGEIVVVGGGAAGIFAAFFAAMKGAPVRLLEKKGRLGTKILISGGGKCNVTHAGPIDDVRTQFRQNEGRFLNPSFHRFDNEDFVRMLEAKGMALHTRPDGRIFPRDGDAKDVVAILESHLRDAGVRVSLGTPVVGVEVDAGRVTGVRLENGSLLPSRHVVIAVGGSSYPATGTTGDGWRWLSALGHTIVPLRAALAPIYLDPAPPAEWSGIALRDCILKARREAEGGPGKEIARWRDDLLWTHKGISGPTALGISREIAEVLPHPVRVEADILPHETFETLTRNIRDHCQKHPRRAIADFLEPLLPNRLVKPILEAAGVNPATRCAYLGQKERNRLVEILKGWPLGRVRSVPLERGEVVAGGVALDEVDPRTMRSRKVDGLYLCGEVLDIAGPVGGYNLQAAWSTGNIAGETAASDWMAKGA